MTDKEKLEKLKKLADAMYYAAQYLTTDASRLHKAMDEYHKFIIHEYKEEPASEKKCMFTKDSYTNEDRKVLCEDCKKKCAYNIAGIISTNAQVKKEPVIGDLEKAAEMFIDSLIPTEVDTVTPFAAEYVIELLNKAIEFGANWQKEQILDCNTTLQRTFELGKQEMKQQMMAEAVDAVVKIDAGGYPYVDRTIELYDYDNDIPLAKRGDKVKVIVIKED